VSSSPFVTIANTVSATSCRHVVPVVLAPSSTCFDLFLPSLPSLAGVLLPEVLYGDESGGAVAFVELNVKRTLMAPDANTLSNPTTLQCGGGSRRRELGKDDGSYLSSPAPFSDELRRRILTADPANVKQISFPVFDSKGNFKSTSNHWVKDEVSSLLPMETAAYEIKARLWFRDAYGSGNMPSDWSPTLEFFAVTTAPQCCNGGGITKPYSPTSHTPITVR
jgi:hypothetical protein